MPTSTSASIRALLVLVSLSVAHCSSPTSPGTRVTVTRVRSDPTALVSVSGYTAPTTLVIRNAQDFAAVWALAYQGVNPAPAMPGVDFATQMVVGVAVGTRPNADTDVLITGGSETGGTITIDATITTAPSCPVLTIVTSPLDLAIVSATTDSVRTNLTRKTRSC